MPVSEDIFLLLLENNIAQISSFCYSSKFDKIAISLKIQIYLQKKPGLRVESLGVALV